MTKFKCHKCNKDAVVVERDTFYSCADCWIKNNTHKKGLKRNEKNPRVS